MKAWYFFKKKERWIGTEKLYMLLRFSAKEQAMIAREGGFDQILNPTVPLVKEAFLKGERKFPNGTAAYVFRSLLKDLDYVRRGLEKALKRKCIIVSTDDVPTYESLLLQSITR